MPDKRINRNVNENRFFRKEAYGGRNKFHKRDLRLNKGAVSGMAKEKGIAAVEDSILRLLNGEHHSLALLSEYIILVATWHSRKYQNKQG